MKNIFGIFILAGLVLWISGCGTTCEDVKKLEKSKADAVTAVNAKITAKQKDDATKELEKLEAVCKKMGDISTGLECKLSGSDTKKEIKGSELKDDCMRSHDDLKKQIAKL